MGPGGSQVGLKGEIYFPFRIVMAAVATKKVHNCKVRAIPREGGEDKRPIKGYELCPCLYANIYLVAKKNSGKTTVIWNIVDRCTGRDTIISAWVSTFNNDA